MKADSEGLDSKVCFGMFTIPNIAILKPQILSPNAEMVCVEVSSGRLTTLAEDEHHKQIVGSIRDGLHVEILQSLQNQSCLRLQMYCQVKSGSTVRTPARINVHGQCELSVIVYDEVRILISLSGVTDLEETETPTIMKTPLKSHQKQALTFLLRRERRWAFDASYDDIWTKALGSSAGYCNNVKAKCQSEMSEQSSSTILGRDHGGSDGVGLDLTYGCPCGFGCRQDPTRWPHRMERARARKYTYYGPVAS
ncbi:hypothetical protein JMJ35_003061 [Cladonia borealis]|uniref:Uncharacterized protein n=1 Tax=Cladonia borealis TaxID=184061 RepID=A0AA39R6B4_9LECA|nr:hypothetical protein JMJ35_003061 [Cladonia borealis]